jgi:hypothetical protein
VQPLTAARTPLKLVEKAQPEIVLLGRQAIDDDASGKRLQINAANCMHCKTCTQGSVRDHQLDDAGRWFGPERPEPVTESTYHGRDRYSLPDIGVRGNFVQGSMVARIAATVLVSVGAWFSSADLRAEIVVAIPPGFEVRRVEPGSETTFVFDARNTGGTRASVHL